MKHLLFLFVLSLAWIPTSIALLQTDTHTYILGTDSQKILAFNRVSGDETLITLDFIPHSMVIHKKTGYVIGPSGKFYILDLLKNEVTHRFTFGDTLKEFKINTLLNTGVLIFRTAFCLFDLLTHEPKNLSHCYQEIGTTYILDFFLFFTTKQSKTIYRKDLRIKDDYCLDQIDLYENPLEIYFHDSTLYVTTLTKLFIIDLIEWKIGAKIDTGRDYCNKIEFQGDYGYCVGFFCSNQCIDLKRREFISRDRAPPYLAGFTSYKGKDYGCVDGNFIQRDSMTHKIINQLDVEENYDVLGFYGFYIYLSSNDIIYILDLVTLDPYLMIFPQFNPRSMEIRNGYGFIGTNDHHLLVLDLGTHKIVDTFYYWEDITISPTHLYRGTQKVREVNKPGFFDHPYKGLHGAILFEESTEDDFGHFEAALSKGEYLSARKHLEKALISGHPKANAIAAYAFFFGKWGAVDEGTKWFDAYSAVMDKPYFFTLVNEAFDIKFTPKLK